MTALLLAGCLVMGFFGGAAVVITVIILMGKDPT